MTKLILPKMLEKKRGIIVNVSSSGGAMNVPMNTVYCATKVRSIITYQYIIIVVISCQQLLHDAVFREFLF